MRDEELIAAGLYDPDADDADDRRALLDYTADSGATLEEIVAADRDGDLTSLVNDVHLRRGELSAVDLAERSGRSLDDVLDVLLHLGVGVVDPDDRIFGDAELRVLQLLSAAAPMIPPGLTDEILRTAGMALDAIAETAISVFVGSLEDELDQHGGQLRRAQITAAAGDLGVEMGVTLGPLLRHHLRRATARQRAAMRGAESRLDMTLALGFVDLVGFTESTAAMRPEELLEFIQGFHHRTFDIVTSSGGRVVKHIGDEVMFTAETAVRAAEIGLQLVEEYAETRFVPSGGIAFGTVVARHGDHYGPIVNLAARLADIAVPGELLADVASAADLRAGGFGVEPAGRRMLKGFSDPVSTVSVGRLVDG